MCHKERSITLEILDKILDKIFDFLREHRKEKEQPHPFWSRLLAASWGSGVFHGALLVYTLNRHFEAASDFAGRPADLDTYIIVIGYFFVSAFIIIYLLTFGLTVAVSRPKSPLIRHFMYGVLLPAFAYFIAGKA